VWVAVAVLWVPGMYVTYLLLSRRNQ
jgi:hypothetical protein